MNPSIIESFESSGFKVKDMPNDVKIELSK